jgi:hypothetical protein
VYQIAVENTSSTKVILQKGFPMAIATEINPMLETLPLTTQNLEIIDMEYNPGSIMIANINLSPIELPQKQIIENIKEIDHDVATNTTVLNSDQTEESPKFQTPATSKPFA